MIWTVAWHEFWFTVRKKSFYLVTLGMPLLLLGYIGVIMLMIAITVPSEISRMSRPVGLVDAAEILTGEKGKLAEAKMGEIFELKIEDQELAEELPPELEKLGDIASSSGLENLFERKILLLENVGEGKSRLVDETLNAIVVIPQDYVEKGRFQIYSQRSDLISSTMSVGWLSNLVADQLLAETDLTQKQIDRIRNASSTDEYEINKVGEFEKVNTLSKALSLGLPLSVSGLLVFALMMNASLLLASIAEEKENKVMEVILSSVSADDLLFGKVLGIVMAGLLQIAIWMAMVSVMPALSMFALGEIVDYEINVIQLAMSVVFMLVGFVFYGGFLAGLGSLGSSYKDCQQLSAVVIVSACVPLFLLTTFLSSPNGMAAKVLSWVPFFSPIGMSLRLGATEVAWWEVIGSLLLLVFSTWLALKIAAKLFRAGTLMRGKAPSVLQIWRVLMGSA
jgi:ABC-2 type transport system permease protein